MTDDTEKKPKTPVLKIQVSRDDHGALVAQNVFSDFVDASGERLLLIGEVISSFAGGVMNNLGDVARRPEKVKLEFGINAGGKVGIPFITEGSAETNLKVTVEWNLK
jgi:Trypsin-co-occurring domain 1